MENRREHIYSAIVNASIGLFVSLFICVFTVGGNLFWSLIPIWMFLSGTIINFVLELIKPIADKKKVKCVMMLGIAVLMVVILKYI